MSNEFFLGLLVSNVRADPCARSGVILFGSCSLPQILGTNGLVVVVVCLQRFNAGFIHKLLLTLAYKLCNFRFRGLRTYCLLANCV